MTSTPAAHGLASALQRVERMLHAELTLRPLPIDPDLAACAGAFRTEPVSLKVHAFGGDRVRYARSVSITGRGLEIANLLCLPDPGLDCPMLGIDLVHVRADRVVVVSDLLPSLPAAVSRSRTVPSWAEEFFSGDAQLDHVAPAALGPAIERMTGNAERFAGLARDAVHDPARSARRRQWQDAYCHAHRRDDTALAMLGRIFGDAWASRFIGEVLFPTATAVDADTAFERLRGRTRQQHRRLEEVVALMREDVSRDDYVRFLIATEACAVPMEREIARLAPPDVPVGCTALPRAEWLKQDLRSIGYAAASDEPRPTLQVPIPRTWSEAAGMAYVLEGATLGGQVLTRHLRARLALDESALHYVSSYGAETGRRWRAFRVYLGELMAASRHHEDAVVAGAVAAFEAFTSAYCAGARGSYITI